MFFFFKLKKIFAKVFEEVFIILVISVSRLVDLGTSFYTGSGRHDATGLQQCPFLPSQGDGGWMELRMQSHPEQSSAILGSMNICISWCLPSVDIQYSCVCKAWCNLHSGPGLSCFGSNDPPAGTMH